MPCFSFSPLQVADDSRHQLVCGDTASTVFWCQILASELTVGYNDVPAFVKAVQGRPIRGLAELVKIVTDSREKFLEFTVELTDAKAVPLVLNREKAIAVNPQILEQNNILRDRSAYL